MNEKKIAYVVIDNGIEGKTPDRIVFGTYDQNEQIDFYQTSTKNLGLD